MFSRLVGLAVGAAFFFGLPRLAWGQDFQGVVWNPATSEVVARFGEARLRLVVPGGRSAEAEARLSVIGRDGGGRFFEPGGGVLSVIRRGRGLDRWVGSGRWSGDPVLSRSGGLAFYEEGGWTVGVWAQPGMGQGAFFDGLVEVGRSGVGLRSGVLGRDGIWRAGRGAVEGEVRYWMTGVRGTGVAARGRIWSAAFVTAAEARVGRSFPQTVTFVNAVSPAIGMRPEVGERASMGESGGEVERWWSGDGVTGRVGGPTRQDSVLFSSGDNGLRATAGMMGWGVHRWQTSAVGRAEELARLLLEASPEDGFALRVGRGGGGVEAGSLSDEAATAFWALEFAEWAPDSAVVVGLLERAGRVAGRVARSEGNLGSAAGPAGLALLGRVARSERSELAGVREEARLAFARAWEGSWRGDERAGESVWAIEVASEAVRAGLRGAAGWAEGILESWFVRQQLADDPLVGDLATFGALRGGPGAGRVGSAGLARDTGVYGAALVRLGAAAGRRDWMRRGVAAVRSTFGLWRVNPLTAGLRSVEGLWVGQAWPSWGETVMNGPDPRVSWESAEGLKVALTWELVGRYGSAFLKPGMEVGIDGMDWWNGRLVFSLYGNPEPFDKVEVSGTRREEGGEMSPVDDDTVARRFVVSDVRVIGREVVASPGLSLRSVEDMVGSEGVLERGGSRVRLSPGGEGFVGDWPGGTGRVRALVEVDGARAEWEGLAGEGLAPLDVVGRSGWRVRRGMAEGYVGGRLSTGPGVLTSVVESPALVGRGRLRLDLRVGEGCRVEIADAESGEVLRTFGSGRLDVELVTLGAERVVVRLVDAGRGWIEAREVDG